MRALALFVLAGALTAVSLTGCLTPSPNGASPLGRTSVLAQVPFLGSIVAPPPRFGPEVVVDDKLGATEPSLVVDKDGRIFVAAPAGLSPTGDLLDHHFSGQFWRSQDGQSFQHLEGLGVAGLYGPSVGGGDSDIAADGQGNLYAIDLWLGNVGLLTSQDHGDSWLRGAPVTFATPGEDRQWIDVDQKTGDVYITANSLSTGLWVLKSSDAGLTFPQQTLAVPHGDRGGCICPPGALAVDEATGNVYLPFYVNPQGVGIAVSKDGGASFDVALVPGTEAAHLADEQKGELGGSFTVVQHDTAGNLYLVWEAASKTGRRVMLQTSTDEGKTWTAPAIVSSLASGNQIFPWVVAGEPGRVAVAWYELTGEGPTWNVRLGFSDNALDAVPSFQVITLNHSPVAEGNYDREALGDFFEIAMGPDGAIHAVWNEKRGQGHVIVYAGQVDGPTLLLHPQAPAAQGQGGLAVPAVPVAPKLPALPLGLG
jgi:hypothetical protein